jgi:DNA-binding transcriptional LysR family regulator
MRRKMALCLPKIRRQQFHMAETEGSPRKGLNLRLLEIFAAVVHANGMTGAATALGLTQSAVSQAIANLETSVNARLIDRGTRPLKLTLLGDIIYRRTIEILDRVQDLDRAIELQLNNAIPMLRLGVADSVASTAGPHLVRNLDKLAAQFMIWSGASEASVRSLAERKVDFILTAEEAPPEVEFVSIPIFEEPYVLVLPIELSEPHYTLETLIAAAPFIRYGNQSFIGLAVDAYLQRNGVMPPNRYRLDTSDSVLAMVEASMGWTISTPLGILKTRIGSPRFHCLPLPSTAPTRRISLVARRAEGEALALQIADAARNALVEHCLPGLKEIAPGAVFRSEFS